MGLLLNFRALFLVATLAVTTGMMASNQSASCYISNSPVNEGETVFIICEFTPELSPTSEVILKWTATLDTHSQDVIRYKWDGSSFKIDRREKEGYQLSETSNSTHLNVTIQHAAKSQEGFYSCQVTGFTTTGCELQIKEIPYEASCEGSNVPNGHPAQVVFFFNKDVHLSRTRFLITRRPFHITDVVHIVLDCGENKDNRPCSTASSGYEFNPGNFSTNVTLDIPSASSDQEGIYEVLIQYKYPTKSAPCYVRLSDGEERPQTTESTTHSTKVECNSKDDGDLQEKVHAILGIVIILLIGMVIHFICVCIERKKAK